MNNTETRPTKEAIDKKRVELAARGVNLREMCDAAGVSYQACREVLCGKATGRRGNSHKAAVFLGLKADPDKLSAQ